MKEIFENLYESVSEACFNDIMDIVEELLDENAVDDYATKKAEEYKNAKKLVKHYAKTSDRKASKQYNKQVGEVKKAEDRALWAEGDLIDSAPSEYSFKTKQEQKEDDERATSNWANTIRKLDKEKEKLSKIKGTFSPELKGALQNRREAGIKELRARHYLQQRNANTKKHYGEGNN